MKKWLNEFRFYLLDKGYSEMTINSCQNEVNKFREWLANKTKKREQRITYRDALKYVQYMQQRGLSPRTINIRIVCTRHYYNFLKVKKNPFQGLEIKGERKRVMTDILTKEELKQIYLDFKPRTPLQKRNKVMLGLFCFQGVIPREIEYITLEDLDLEKGTIKITRTNQLNSRSLKLEVEQVKAIMDYLREVRPKLIRQNKSAGESLIVLTTPSHNNINNSLAKLAEMLRRQHRKFNSFRQLRRSVIVNWLKEENIRVVQYKAGHRYVSSTERYRTNNLQQLKEAILEAHPLD